MSQGHLIPQMQTEVNLYSKNNQKTFIKPSEPRNEVFCEVWGSESTYNEETGSARLNNLLSPTKSYV